MKEELSTRRFPKEKASLRQAKAKSLTLWQRVCQKSKQILIEIFFSTNISDPDNYEVFENSKLDIQEMFWGCVIIVKNGEVYAQLRCANGRLGGKISVKEELQEEGITVEELKLAMQMEIIKEQLIKLEGLFAAYEYKEMANK